MENFDEYMVKFKEKSLIDKKEISLEQLKIVAGLVDRMCDELGSDNELLVTKDILEGHTMLDSESEYVEAVVTYTSSIQRSLCSLTDKITEFLENSISDK